jgi:hypothetical protein
MIILVLYIQKIMEHPQDMYYANMNTLPNNIRWLTEYMAVFYFSPSRMIHH